MAIIICNCLVKQQTNERMKEFSVLFFFRKNSRNLCLYIYIERSKVNPDDFSFSNYSEPELNNCLILCVLPFFFF